MHTPLASWPLTRTLRALFSTPRAEQKTIRASLRKQPASTIIRTACAASVLALLLTGHASAADAPKRQVVTFTDLSLTSAEAWNGSDLQGGFVSRKVHFKNVYNTDYGSWAGIAYSRVHNTNSADYANQYAVWAPGVGISGTGNYAIVYDDGAWGNADVITLPSAATVHGFYINNTTYAALSMLNGDGFAKKFGGDTGNDEDWLKLTVTGKDSNGQSVGTVAFYLADYRFADNAKDYMIQDWTWVDLSALGPMVRTLEFALSSSDIGAWGMNTPAYFALDNLEFTAQPTLPTASFDSLLFSSTNYWNGSEGVGAFTNAGIVFSNTYIDWGGYSSWAGFAYSCVNNTNTEGYLNQFAVWNPGTGLGATGNYAIVYDDGLYGGNSDVLTVPTASTIHGFYVNNTTYAALSMLNGDGFAKKFGGTTGNDPDWFKLTIIGKNKAGTLIGTVDFYLADYRFTDNTRDYIIDAWTWVDLTRLGGAVTSLEFTLSSSDTGDWGMNTPAYFAMDNVQYSPTARLSTANLDALPFTSDNFWNGADGSGGFTNAGVFFSNAFTDWGDGYFSWSGFAYSRTNDTQTAGFDNPYAVWTPGTDVSTTGNYAIAYDGGTWGTPVITLPFPSTVNGFAINNTTYAALSMLNGDWSAKKFGGETGNDPDWFKLTITAKTSSGRILGTREVYLADFQFTDNRNDYVLSGWNWVDLSSFGKAVTSLEFTLSSSDTGSWGINTPTYFALDNLLFTTTSRGTLILIP